MGSADDFRNRLIFALQSRGAEADFLRKTGFSRAVVYNWKQGLSTPKLKDLEVIAMGLGITVPELVAPPGAGLTMPLSAAAREIVALLPAADQSQATEDLLDALRARLGLAGASARQEKQDRHRKR